MEMGKVHEEGLNLPDSVPSIVSMTGHINYHAAQQVFIVNWLPDMFDKGKKSCKTDLHRADYTVTAGIGAHKLHRNMVNWNEARRTCAAEGGNANYLYMWVSRSFRWIKNRKMGEELTLGIDFECDVDVL